ncbi:MAG TPA: hypothetical protein VNB22_09905 [Pyrinomonadaceae bacterium]|jgi:hypothetical protein|nr:hypothetical protein [Pyrinomonadaceae bacterium]
MKNISDEQFRAYFLGKLPEPEAEILEIECVSSAVLTEQAQVVEGELADDYLRGNLLAADAALFETNYLITEARREKLRVAEGLWEIVKAPARKPATVISAAPGSLLQTLFGRRKAFQFAFGGLILLLVFGAAAFYLLTLTINKTDVAEVKDANQASKNETPVIQKPDNRIAQNPATENQNPRSVSTNPVVQNKEPAPEAALPQKNLPEIKSVSTPKNVEPKRSALALVVKLMPGSLRDEGEQSLTIAPNVKNLNFLLSPAGEPNNYKIYRAVLKTPEDGVIFTSPNLKSLSFMLPAEKLQNRTYVISLEGQNPQSEFESIADYTFRVRR